MKFKNICVIILGFILLVSCKKNSVEVNDFKKVNFNKVVDGETIKISIDGKLEDVKLLLIDVPKIRGGYRFSNEAKKFLQGKLSNKEYVYLEMDGQDRNKQGKILAYVWYNDGEEFKMLNEEIIGEGLARVAYVFDGAKYLDNLNLVQESARVERKNIWSIDGYVTDKGFKK